MPVAEQPGSALSTMAAAAASVVIAVARVAMFVTVAGRLIIT
jgi:hypothetical protein